MNVSADICPAKGERVITSPYQFSISCPAATIVVKGERNPDKYESCLGDVPYATERVYYVAHDGNLMGLPTINSMLRKGDLFALRLWVVGDLEPPDIHCNGKDVVSIKYWGGGNCTGCERTVNYNFSSGGKLERATFK